MYKITIDQLEKIKKALENSNSLLRNHPNERGPNTNFLPDAKISKTISENEKAIKLIDDEYLNIKS